VKPIEALTASFEAWKAGDPAALAALFTDDGEFIDPLKPGVLTGPEEIEAGNRDAMAMLEDVEIEVARGFEDGEHGAVEGEFRSRLADGGARFDFAFMAVADLRDGKVRRLAEYFDTKPLLP
jgi:ketosteroid isomerase-like protein